MQIFQSLILSALTATAYAQPAEHHHAHRREAEPEPVMDFVTVYNTFYVTAGAENAAAATATASSSSSSTPAPWTPAASTTSSSTSESVNTVTTSPEHTSSAASTSSSSSSSSSSSAPASTNTGSSSGDAGSAGARGITYSPYSNQGGCKSSSQVANDLHKLSGYPVLRLYGTDCNQVANVYNAKASGQKLFLGVFDVNNIENQIESMNQQLNGDWSDVITVSIGNELVNDGKASVDQVGQYVSTGRSKLRQVGYNGPVVTVDTFIATINNPSLCDVSDYLAVNAHAYFDGGVSAQQAGEWANQQIERVWSACGGKKKVTIVESGWPSQGPTNGKAVCSEQNQKDAINSLKSSIGNDVFLFNAYNDLWKTPGVEQWWGVYGTASS